MIQQLPHLTPEQSARVFAIANEAAQIDGVNPLSEHVALHLRQGGDDHDSHFLATLEDTIVGYAHLDTSDAVEGPSAELVVAPSARRNGIGKELLAHLINTAPDRLRLWSHGDHASAEELSKTLGFVRTRRLLQMRRSLELPLPQIKTPANLNITSFSHRDIEEWLAVHARSFSGHPEQGIWNKSDLEIRLAEPWFDPLGFFIARDETSKIVAFCWTKIHGNSISPIHGHQTIGEIYVIGVDPQHGGRGYGKALVLQGLSYMRDRGLRTAMLYVESDNHPALKLYQSLQFTEWAVDVMYRRVTS